MQHWKSSIYLRNGYGVRNSVGVRVDNEEYVVTINGVEVERFVDAKEPVCQGNRKGVVAVITWMEDFPRTAVKTWYTEQ